MYTSSQGVSAKDRQPNLHFSISVFVAYLMLPRSCQWSSRVCLHHTLTISLAKHALIVLLLLVTACSGITRMAWQVVMSLSLRYFQHNAVGL